MNEKIDKVHKFLEEHGIEYKTHYHPPLPTIELALEYWKEIDSTHCKNLFFRNHKGNRHYLVIFECHKELDIHSLEKSLHQGKLSFASAERMERCLGLQPGSVSLFGLIQDMNLVERGEDGRNHIVTPLAIPLIESGNVILVNAFIGLAPKSLPASIKLLSILLSTVYIGKIINGK